MILAAHQPNFLPNLGFFYKMSQADAFVIFTNLQFAKRDNWVRRHKILDSNGNDQWLTVPVLGSSRNQLIKDVQINNTSKWRRKHSAALKQTYSNTVEKNALDAILAVYEQPWERLVDLNVEIILTMRGLLGITTPVIVDEEVTGERQELMINTCKKHGADCYLSGLGGKIYMTDEYRADLVSNGLSMQFVEKDITSQYPYTALHYLLTEGSDALSNLFEREKQMALHGFTLPFLAEGFEPFVHCCVAAEYLVSL